MSKVFKSTVVLTLLGCSIAADATTPKVGANVDGGIFLFREPLEVYWNDWVGFPLMQKRSSVTGQARLTVTGEGKTASFVGTLSINCENRKYFWETAANGIENLSPSNEKRINEIVPRQVVNNATRLLCK